MRIRKRTEQQRLLEQQQPEQLLNCWTKVFGMDLSDIYLGLDNLNNVDTSDHSLKNPHPRDLILVPNYTTKHLTFREDETVKADVDVVVEVDAVDGHADYGVGMLEHGC